MYLKGNGDRLLWTGSYLEQISTFRAGVDVSNFTVGPSRQRGGIPFLSRRVCSSGISWCIFSVVKMALHRHRAGFESQCASPFRKRVNALKVPGEAARA